MSLFLCLLSLHQHSTLATALTKSATASGTVKAAAETSKALFYLLLALLSIIAVGASAGVLLAYTVTPSAPSAPDASAEAAVVDTKHERVYAAAVEQSDAASNNTVAISIVSVVSVLVVLLVSGGVYNVRKEQRMLEARHQEFLAQPVSDGFDFSDDADLSEHEMKSVASGSETSFSESE